MRWWVLAIVCACGLAHADPKTDADAHLDRGKHLYEIQDYDGAIAEYQAGYLIEQRADFLYGIGQAYRMKGDCERAIRSYDMVVRAPDGASLAEAARKNIDRCHEAQPPQQPQPPPPPPLPPLQHEQPTPPHAVAATPWYRDTLGDVMVAGGVVLVVGGVISWKVGRGEADRTYDATSYDAWSSSTRDARHAETLQRIGIAGVALGGAAVIAGVIHVVWPAQQRVDAVVTPGGAGVAFAF